MPPGMTEVDSFISLHHPLLIAWVNFGALADFCYLCDYD